MKVGVRVGAYVLTAEVGAGSQGRTWVAEPVDGAPRVLLKQLIALDEEGRARFRREATILSQLDSPHIPRLVDAFEAAGSHWLALELVPGCNLQAVIAAVPRFAQDVAALVGAEVARGLDGAHGHRRAFVHRDVAPQNVLIGLEGEVKITDFGLAGGRRERVITDEGEVHGRARYIAPEYGRTGIDTAQADMYSLGVVLYRCLAERFPFEGPSLSDLLPKIEAGDFERLQDARPDLDPALCELVDTLLSADAGRRPSAAEVDEALSPFVTEHARVKLRTWARNLAAPWADDPGEVTVPLIAVPPRRPSGVAMAAGAIAVGVLAAGAWGWQAVRVERATMASTAAPTGDPAPAPAGAAGPDATLAPPDAGPAVPAEPAPPPEATEAAPEAPATTPRRVGVVIVQRRPYASIYVDGHLHGREFAAGDLVLRLSPGEHVIRAEGPPEVRGQRRVIVEAGERSVVRFGPDPQHDRWKVGP